MFVKKALSAISMILILALLLSMAAPLGALAAEETLTEKALTAYLYKADATDTVSCLFKSTLPDMPYISTVDYLKRVYVEPPAETANGDGTYTVTNGQGTMVVDPEKDTLHFDVLEYFIENAAIQEGSMLDVNYLKTVDAGFEGESKSLDLDLSAYGIDLLEKDGQTYFPLSTLSLLTSMIYNAGVYANGSIYFIHTTDLLSGDAYFDRSELFSTLERSQDLVDLTYHELCFAMDHLYGRPSKVEIAQALEEKPFDQVLDSFSDVTRRAKALLKSSSRVDYITGMTLLTDAFWDGGHTVLVIPLSDAKASAPASPVAQALTAKINNREDPDVAQMTNALSLMVSSARRKGGLKALRQTEYAKYQLVQAWDDDAGAMLLMDGSTAVFAFDSFVNEAVEHFKWSLDYAKEHGVKRFVIDLSCNGGGSSAVLNYMMALMTNKDGTRNLVVHRQLKTMTGSIIHSDYEVDLNLDGTVDEKDKEVYYDFEYMILTSGASFSCGNLLPCVASDAGITIIGETSGGGSCSMTPIFTPEGAYYTLSGYTKFIRADNTDVETGAAPDYVLTREGVDEEGNPALDYTGLYDISNYKYTHFTDLKKTSWYHDGILWALENGVMDGVGGRSFAPDKAMSRAMIVTMLYRMEGKPEVASEGIFSDVPKDTWYTDAVAWAQANGIVKGMGGNRFAPTAILTREQLVTILQRYAAYKGVDATAAESASLSAFRDASRVSQWADKAMRWAVQEGIISGVGNQTLDPKGNATRAQGAKMLMSLDSVA